MRRNQREILFEFTPAFRHYVKVSAIDSSTLEEASLLLRAGTPRHDMEKLVIKRLFAHKNQKTRRGRTSRTAVFQKRRTDRKSGWDY